MKNKFFPIFLTSIFIIIFIIFYKGLYDSKIYTPETKINNDISSFSSELLYFNKRVNSSEVFNLDKFYLVNIWSSWCIPCKQEHPILMNLSKNENLIVFGINYKDTKKNAKDFLNDYGNPYSKIFYDSKGIIAIEWAAYGVPESFLLYDGKIIRKYIGPLNQKLAEEIRSLIK